MRGGPRARRQVKEKVELFSHCFCNPQVDCSPLALTWAFEIFASDEITALGAGEDADLHAVESHEVFVVHVFWNYHHCFHVISIAYTLGQILSNGHFR